MKIGIDIDEVIAEFVEGYFAFYNLKHNKNFKYEDAFTYDLWKVLGISKENAFKIAREYYDSEFFDHIKLVSGSIEGINKLYQNNELFFITSRPKEIEKQTKEFLEKHFPKLSLNLIHSFNPLEKQGKSKAEISKELKISFLIEDHEEYALECAKKGIKVLLFDKPWNRNIQTHENIIKVLNWGEILEIIK